MSDDPVRVLVVDDDADVRMLVRQMLSKAPGWICVGEAADGVAAVELANVTAPDVVVLDLNMPVLGGEEALPQLRCVAPGAMVVIFTAYHLDEKTDHRLRAAGAFTCRGKTDMARLDELLRQDLVRFRGSLGAPSSEKPV